MTQFHLRINTDNAAFADGDHGPELARILRAIAKRLEDAGSIPDGIDAYETGNRCGYYSADAHDAEV